MSKSKRRSADPQISTNMLDILPNEDVWKILLNLSPQDILNFCKTERRIATICSSDKFWEVYAKSRGIEKGYQNTWKEAVKSSTTGYVHIDLTNVLGPALKGFKGDIEYIVKNHDVSIVWKSGVPFLPEEKAVFKDLLSFSSIQVRLPIHEKVRKYICRDNFKDIS